MVEKVEIAIELNCLGIKIVITVVVEVEEAVGLHNLRYIPLCHLI